MSDACLDILLVIVALFFPPIAVVVKRGVCSADLLINVALCFLGYIPGTLHAWYIIANYSSETSRRYDDEEAIYYITYKSAHNNKKVKKPVKKPVAARVENNVVAGAALLPQNYGSLSNVGTSAALLSDSGESNDAPPPAYTDVVGSTDFAKSTDNKQTI